MIHLATATKTTRQVPGDIPDEDFVAALDFEFRNAPMIARHMLMAGTPATLTTIRQRMAEFVAESPYIEAGEDAWRIVATSPTIPPQPANDDHKINLPMSVTAPLLINGCGLEMLRGLPDASIHLALLDLPYGITRTSFDPVIDVDAHMKELRRVVTSTGAIICFATQPFTTKLINAAPDLFKQSLVWEKPQGTGFAQARQRHLKCHEDILVFSKGTVIGGERSKRKMTFNPQGTAEVERVLRKRKTKYMADVKGDDTGKRYMALTNCPRSVLRYAKDSKVHSFAKPIALLEYLIRTFSNDNEVVLDHTMGSGSTGVAAYRTGRRFIGAENGYLEDGCSVFKIAEGRIGAELTGQDNPRPTPPKPSGGKPQKKRRAWSAEQRAKYAATMASKRTGVTVPAQAKSASNDNAKYEVPTSTIHEGDCLEVMRDMPAASVDMIFTSPPYNLGVSTGGGVRGAKSGKWSNMALAEGYASYDDARAPTNYIAWQKDCLTEMWRLLRDEGAIFYNHKPRVQKGILQTPLDLNPSLPVRQILIWNRKTGFNYSQSFYCPAHEWIVIFAKPGFRLRDRKASGAQDVWTIPHERNNKHPAPFPVDLPLRAIETTTAQVILDPFCGSGTTGVAAKRLSRSFIGIELDPGYCQIARDRIAGEPISLAA